jgi:hypothetical protein
MAVHHHDDDVMDAMLRSCEAIDTASLSLIF